MLILAEQPGVASQSFATPGYKSVALRAIKSAGTLALLLHIRRHNKYKNCREAARLKSLYQFRQICNLPVHLFCWYIRRHRTFGKRCPKGYTYVTVGGTPTDAKTGEITRSGDTFFKKTLT